MAVYCSLKSPCLKRAPARWLALPNLFEALDDICPFQVMRDTYLMLKRPGCILVS
jgi:hypothetical protein